MWPRLVASASARQHPGAHAGGRLGRRWATPTAQGPFLQPPRGAAAGMRPGNPLGPGGRTSLTQAQPCVAAPTHAHGRSLAGCNATPPVLWRTAGGPQGAARGSPAPHAPLPGGAGTQRTCSRAGRRLRTRPAVSAPSPCAPRWAWTRARALIEAALDRLRGPGTAPPPRLRLTGALPRLRQPCAEDGRRGRPPCEVAEAPRQAALPSSRERRWHRKQCVGQPPYVGDRAQQARQNTPPGAEHARPLASGK